MILSSYHSEKLWTTVSVLSIIGIALATYLLYGTLHPDPLQSCSINAWINCEPVTKGSLAYFFGIPVAFIGLVGYFAILAAAVARHKRLLLAVASFGVIFCLRLTALEVFVEKIICPVCILCLFIMLTIFVLSIVLFNRKDESKIARIRNALMRIFRK